jgi:hypothetical protein
MPAVLTLLALLAFQTPPASAEVTVWMSPGGPYGIWQKACGDPFPVKRLVGDLADLGVTEILFFEQEGRGGGFLHPTTVQHAAASKRVPGRDALGELLAETTPKNIKVWLAWTPPGGKYPGTDINGLNNPALIKIYTDTIEEVARNYGRYRNLAGIMWHEVDCAEVVDSHADDVGEFAEFCHRQFGEKYPGDAMPKIDPSDKWWRRFFLYRNHVVNEFVRQTGAVARKHGLQIHFCSYAPEAFTGESWKWGYDIVALEKLCERQWFSGYGVESGKPYQNVRGTCIDFGPSYRGQILARNYSYAMHGRPLSYFEYRSPVYLDEVRRYYAQVKGFKEKNGDFYTGFSGKQQKELDLFFGKDNLKRWLDLMTRWQGGASAARVAVAVNPNAFIMKHPLATGGQYNEKIRALMVALSEQTDVDGLLLESQFALDARNLSRYSLIVIPEDMGSGLTEPMVQALKRYVAEKGKLLIVSTALTTARPDLTNETDLTPEFCGAQITGPGLSGYVTPAGGNKFWSGGIKPVRLNSAEVMLKHGVNSEPLLVKKGNALFFTAGCSQEGARFLAGLLPQITQLPITLTDNNGIRILESVVKDGLMCLTFWGKGKAKLRFDTREPVVHVREIVADAFQGDFTAAQLAAGIPIEIRHTYQPFILVVGPKESCETFRAMHPSPASFAGMKEKQNIENPEVPREALGAPRDKEIGVLEYTRKYKTSSERSATEHFKNCLKAVQQTSLKPETVDVDIFLPQNRDARNRYKRLFIPAGAEWFTKAMYEGMGEFVRDGGLLITNSGLYLLDTNANYRADHPTVISDLARDTFLGVRAHASATIRRLKVQQSCPLTAGVPAGDWIPLDPATGGRDTLNRSAEVVFISDCPKGEQPFITVKHSGRGACIYLVGQVGKTPDKTLVQILKNVCSPATLEWLCAQ